MSILSSFYPHIIVWKNGWFSAYFNIPIPHAVPLPKSLRDYLCPKCARAHQKPPHSTHSYIKHKMTLNAQLSTIYEHWRGGGRGYNFPSFRSENPRVGGSIPSLGISVTWAQRPLHQQSCRSLSPRLQKFAFISLRAIISWFKPLSTSKTPLAWSRMLRSQNACETVGYILYFP